MIFDSLTISALGMIALVIGVVGFLIAQDECNCKKRMKKHLKH